jgi:hypothetical protein
MLAPTCFGSFTPGEENNNSEVASPFVLIGFKGVI